jgi:nitric oxide reductase NorD protein
MEEWVGGLWHRLVTRGAGGHHPEAAVHLAEMERPLGILYRAFGGDRGHRVGGAALDRHHARRRWLQRLAGSGERVALAAVENDTLRLPASIDCFAERELNRDLYLWLAALAACAAKTTPLHGDWLARNQKATKDALERFPGLDRRYRRLVAAHLAQRLAPDALPADEAAQENAIRAALLDPGSVTGLPTGTRKTRAPQPVLLWLSPLSHTAAQMPEKSPSPVPVPDGAAAHAANSDASEDNEHKHRAERIALPEPKSPFILMFRAESLPTWGEYVRVNRALDDEPDPNARNTARDLDRLSLARGGTPTRSKVKFDLDLPSEASDDLRLGEGIPLPEWDYRQGVLLPGHVRLQPMQAREAPPATLPGHLVSPARRLRDRFAALVDSRRWQRGQSDGDEIDLDACIRYFGDRRSGGVTPAPGLYCARRPLDRELACLLLADLSMSTDAWVSNSHRVIDVVRDAAFLFCEALTATGDRFGVYGFSSVKRGHVRFHLVKDFAAPYDAKARGRIAALRPGYYTRMGAAVRQATRILAEQPANRRLLLLLSDGKPNDLDEYDSRYGIEDTRMAVVEARRIGITPFCVTIDRAGGAYLPHLFGQDGFLMISDPERLPERLPKLYAELSGL